MTDARVILWGRDIAAVSWIEDRGWAVFQYAPEFVQSGIHVSPIKMPLREGTYEFPELARETFKGLPGLLAESLPDKFGNALIDAWLASQGRVAEEFNPVERLCYLGNRGMGALEFKPAILGAPTSERTLDVAALVRLANEVLSQRSQLSGTLSGVDDTQSIQDILRVGTSAGGARAKAVLSWNEETGEFRSGQLDTDAGFTQWVMKFDGVAGNQDKELADPMGYGRIEYAYSLMAVAAGITMTRCRLHQENKRAHFMTQRFDRTPDGKKLHMQSLGSLMHYDFNRPDTYSYEQAIQACLLLTLPMEDRLQQFRRAVFNAVARNQDDHVKNIAFLMDRGGTWRLSPAFDVAYSYNPSGSWTGKHQMSINGKRDHFERADFLALAKVGDIKKRKALSIVEQTLQACGAWPIHAQAAGVPSDRIEQIYRTFRLTGELRGGR